MRLSELLTEGTSSWIDSLKFVTDGKDPDGEDDDFTIGNVVLHLTSGQVYNVNGVSRKVFNAWSEAPSAGTYFHQNIKDQYVIQ